MNICFVHKCLGRIKFVLLKKKKKQGHSYPPWEGLYSSSLGVYLLSKFFSVKQKSFQTWDIYFDHAWNQNLLVCNHYVE